MTNQMRFTPPSDRKSVRGMITSARDYALRGNTPRVLEHIANGQSKIGLTRREIVSQIQAEHRNEEKQDRTSRRSFPRVTFAPRIANVRRLPSISGFHAIGLGKLSNLTLNELKVKLGVSGFSGYRIGGLTFKLFGVK